MDRGRERLEQEAFDKHNRRRLTRVILRGFITGYITNSLSPDANTKTLAQLQMLNCIHMLQRGGFRKFRSLRMFARRALHDPALQNKIMK